MTLIISERECQQHTVWSREAQKNYTLSSITHILKHRKRGQTQCCSSIDWRRHWENLFSWCRETGIPHWHMTFKGASARWDFRKVPVISVFLYPTMPLLGNSELFHQTSLWLCSKKLDTRISWIVEESKHPIEIRISAPNMEFNEDIEI